MMQPWASTPSTSLFGLAQTFLVCLVVAGTSMQNVVAQSDSVYVRSVSFEGNKNISGESLRLAIATTQSSTFARHPLLRWMGLGSKRDLNERELRRDMLRVKAYYGANGFPEAIVDTTITRSGDAMSVRFHIREGPPVLVKTLWIRGTEGILNESAWRRSLPLKEGAPFAKLLVQPSINVLRALARDAGYPYAEASASFQEDSVGHADVVLTLFAGSLVTIDSVDVHGVTKIEPDVVRRLVSVRSGQRFSAQRMYESQLALHRLGVFQSIGMQLDSADSAIDSSGTVVVQLSEGSFQRLKLSAGYGTLDCFRALASWELYDFLGGGRSLTLSGRLSQLGAGQPFNAGFENSVCPALGNESPDRLRANYHLNASLSDPFFLFNRARATVALFAERATEYQAYLREAIGTEVSTTGRLRGGVPARLAYSISSGRTVADPVTFCSFLNVCRVQDVEIFTERLRRAAVSLELSHSTANTNIDASNGTRTSLGLRWASPLIGSDSLFQLTRIEFEAATYRRIGRAVMAGRISLGTVFAPEITLPSGPERYVPPDQRFYSGGPNSVRGFTQNQLGPIIRVLNTSDSTFQTSAVGGNELVLLNAEMRIPFADDGIFSAAFFVDAGRVRQRGNNDGSNFVVTPGLGWRVLSPIGPLRFDIGYNSKKITRSSLFTTSGEELVLVDPDFQTSSSFFERLRFHFAVGQAF